MSVTNGAHPSIGDADEQVSLRMLSGSVERLRRESDLSGLTRVEAAARAIAQTSEGRTRRKAERLVKKAGLAVDEVRRGNAGAVLPRPVREARQAPGAREDHAAVDPRRSERELAQLLAVRQAALLELIQNDGTPPPESFAPLFGLEQPVGAGRLRLEGVEDAESWEFLLADGYRSSREIFADIDARSLKGQRRDIERTLKGVAVRLIAAGAEVGVLRNDAVPLIAYALFAGELPVAPEAGSVATAERLNDLVLWAAEETATISAESRRIFIALFRLAVLLGEAQCYGETLSLTALSFA